MSIYGQCKGKSRYLRKKSRRFGDALVSKVRAQSHEGTPTPPKHRIETQHKSQPRQTAKARHKVHTRGGRS